MILVRSGDKPMCRMAFVNPPFLWWLKNGPESFNLYQRSQLKHILDPVRQQRIPLIFNENNVMTAFRYVFCQLRSNNIDIGVLTNRGHKPFDTISGACWAFFFVERLWLYFSLLSTDGVYAQSEQETVFTACWNSQFLSWLCGVLSSTENGAT